MKIRDIDEYSSGLRIFYFDEFITEYPVEFKDESDCREKEGGEKALRLIRVSEVRSVIFENNAITVKLYNNCKWTEELKKIIKNIIENFNNKKQ